MSLHDNIIYLNMDEIYAPFEFFFDEPYGHHSCPVSYN